MGWGGAYMDREQTRAGVAECFRLADEVLGEVEAADEGTWPGGPLTIVATDFYESYWVRPRGLREPATGDDHEEVAGSAARTLEAVSSWLRSG